MNPEPKHPLTSPAHSAQRHAHNPISLSVITPALNEEKNIRKAVSNTLDAFDNFGIDGEIIVVNDGSDDRTPDILNEIVGEDDRVSVLTHEKRMGIGASFWDGVIASVNDFVCMLPGDNENDPWEIMRYCRLLDHVDIVIPFVFNKEKRSLIRNGLSFIYRFIINTTFLVYINYTNGTVLYRRSILTDLKFRSSGFFFQTDILIRSVKKGYLFAEVPYKLGARNEGVSKAVTFPGLLQVIKGYLRLVKDIYLDRDANGIQKAFQKSSITAKRRNTGETNP